MSAARRLCRSIEFISRSVGVVLGVFLLFSPAAAQQSAKVVRIGFLHALFPNPFHETFWRSLRDAGYVEGKNLIAERHYAQGSRSRLPELANELVQAQVDVIFAGTNDAVRVARAATRTIPIIGFDLEVDPVQAGLINSFARPGGSLTGVFMDLAELRGKQLALLSDVVPRLSRVAVFWDPTTSRDPLAATQQVARSMGIQLQTLEIQEAAEFERAFAAVGAGRAEALLVLSSPFFFLHRLKIAEYAVGRRLPTITQFREFADGGGLMAYGPNLHDLYRILGLQVARVLNGAKPAELPAERPVKHEFVVNLKTANAIGASVPSRLVMLADEVIR